MRGNFEIIKCDGCSKRLFEPPFYKNDGSDQSTFQKIKDKEICNSCFGKMFSVYIRLNKIPEDDIVELIDKIKPLNERGFVMGFDPSSIKNYTNHLGTFKLEAVDVKNAAKKAWDKVMHSGVENGK